jgi:hypothetical protein
MSDRFIPGGLIPFVVGEVQDVRKFPPSDGKKSFTSVTVIFDEEGYNGGQPFRVRVTCQCYGTIADVVADPKKGLKVGDIAAFWGKPKADAFLIEGKDKPYGKQCCIVNNWCNLTPNGAAGPAEADDTDDDETDEGNPFADC